MQKSSAGLRRQTHRAASFKGNLASLACAGGQSVSSPFGPRQKEAIRRLVSFFIFNRCTLKHWGHTYKYRRSTLRAMMGGLPIYGPCS